MEATMHIPIHDYQAATILPMTRAGRAERTLPQPFEDTLDHLKALEMEATLLLAITWLRRGSRSKGRNKDDDDNEPSFPEFCRDKSLEETQEIFSNVSSDNRRREELTIRLGRPLTFVSFCQEWDLDPFERNVFMLLLMQQVAPDFSTILNDCDLGQRRRTGMEIGHLLAIICSDLRQQLANRRYFSVEATLIRKDLIMTSGDLDDTSNILDEAVCISERLIRYILGDNNLYNSCFRYIKREKSHVSLDQVVLPSGVKEELLEYMEHYLAGKNRGMQDELDNFFGYGTGLVYLFYGASGTGKTMMAHALASHFNRTIFSLSADDMREMPGSYQDIIATIFREAALQGGVVFFDECDDVFEKGSRASRALLIELEKARCVVILATNRAVDLDPALERRISVKTLFPIPEADTRREMWKTLMPSSVTLAKDVNLDEFAERHHFTGGLIRNSIFLAMTAACSNREKEALTLTSELLHLAAGKQTATLADNRNICKISLPSENLDQLPLESKQRARLKNLSLVWERLKKRQTGLSLVISATDISAAEQAARGVARECGLVVRSFDFQQVISRAQEDRLIDPVTQNPVYPIDFAFSSAGGNEAMTLFIDREELLGNMLSMKKEKMADIIMAELLTRLRNHTGMFCIVGRDNGEHPLPPEFSVYEHLIFPEREQQAKKWREQLGGIDEIEAGTLSRIIDDYPLHVSEIDFIIRQAAIMATVRRMEERPTMNELLEVLEKYRGKVKTPLLFGCVEKV